MEAGGLGGRWSSTVLKVRFFLDTLYNFLTLDAFAHGTFDRKRKKAAKKNLKIIYSVVNQPDH